MRGLFMDESRSQREAIRNQVGIGLHARPQSLPTANIGFPSEAHHGFATTGLRPFRLTKEGPT